MRRNQGFTLVELLVAMTGALFLFLAVAAVYSQTVAVSRRVQANAKIQSNIRVGMDRIDRDLRMIGFAVPPGQRIGGSDSWAPAVFYASSSSIGFRADLDGGFAEIVCTPKTTNVNCPVSKLRLDAISYYQGLNCAPPDGSGGSLQLVAVAPDGRWSPLSCSAWATADTSITVGSVANNTFVAGESHAATLEQVYYRYVAGSTPPYGRLERYIRYANTPDDTFPPTGITWTTVATNLTDFWLAYEDAGGTALTGSPLSAANRAAIRKTTVSMEGYDRVGPDGQPQILETRSEILLRND